jgi:hypothetical protein
MAKEYRRLTLQLDRRRVDALRALAMQLGLIARRGPEAGHRGSTAQLLHRVVQEAQATEARVLVFVERREPAHQYEASS